MVRPIFILCMALVFALAACERVTKADLERQAAGHRYLAQLQIVRVCKSGEDSFGKFIQRGPDGRLWVSYYAKPNDWGDVEDIAPGLKATDVC